MHCRGFVSKDLLIFFRFNWYTVISISMVDSSKRKPLKEEQHGWSVFGIPCLDARREELGRTNCCLHIWGSRSLRLEREETHTTTPYLVAVGGGWVRLDTLEKHPSNFLSSAYYRPPRFPSGSRGKKIEEDSQSQRVGKCLTKNVSDWVVQWHFGGNFGFLLLLRSVEVVSDGLTNGRERWKDKMPAV